MVKGTISRILASMCGLAVTAGIVIFAGTTAFAAGDIEINETNFPDKYFREWIASQSYGSDGVLTSDEISKIKTINVSNLSISDLKGIEYFTALEELYCYDNILTNLDASDNVALDSLYCQNNQIRDLIVPQSVHYLNCSDNCLTKLDLARNKNLRSLVCSDNQIDKVYLYNKSPNTMKYDKTTKLVYMSPEEWEFDGFYGGSSSSDGYNEIFVKFKSLNINALDYVSSYKTDFYVSFDRPATCEKDGLKKYAIQLIDVYSLDGKEHSGELEFTTKALGHSWGDWKVTKKATRTSDGEETRVCKNDPSHKQTRAIPKLTPTDTPSSKAITVVCGSGLVMNPQAVIGKGTYTWKSSNPKIATVDSKGKLTALMAGTVNITVTCGSKKLIQPVTVLYKDVTNEKDFWFEPTNYLTAAGIVKGYDNQTKFKPANECSRAQMVTFLWRLNGSPNPKSKTTTFKDIETSDYFYKPVLWAVEKGITTGVTKEKFNPKGICTRAQTVTFLWRMANKPEPKAKTSKFTDIKAKDYFYKAAIWASEKKILAGYDDNTFRPKGHCLRRQMVTFLYKYDKYINRKG